MSDVRIEGAMGLYTIRAVTLKGTRWLRKNISKGASKIGNSIMCEGGRYIREIVAGIDRDGLEVEVNGTSMKGYAKNYEA